jgi:hypothetical protein
MSTGKYIQDTYLSMLTDVIGIAVRQGSYNCMGLAVFSIGMFIISTVFENTVMSTLVVPDKLLIYDIAKLIQSNYKILIANSSGGKLDYNLPHLLEELNASKLTEINDKIKHYTSEIWNNPDTLTKNRSSIFGIATSNAKKFVKQRLNSLTPQHCLCSEVRDLRSTFRVYSFCWHRLRYRIFRNLNLIEAAGCDLFLDWEIERVASDFPASNDDGKGVNTLSDFVSFKNLIPLLVILGCILIFSFICFLFEFRNLFCRVQITCTFPK